MEIKPSQYQMELLAKHLFKQWVNDVEWDELKVSDTNPIYSTRYWRNEARNAINAMNKAQKKNEKVE